MKRYNDRSGALVSLVVTADNQEQLVGAAVESVLAQTYTHFELDGDHNSTDRTLKIARVYTVRDARMWMIAVPHQGRVRSLQGAMAQMQRAYLAESFSGWGRQ